MAMELDYDKSLYGIEHKAGPFEVTKEMVLAFSKSIGQQGEIYNDESAALAAGFKGVVAPPTMCTLMVRHVKLPDIKLSEAHGKARFHAGQRVQTRSNITAGDSLTASSHLKEVYSKTGRSGTMVFIVWETTFSNQEGEVVADVEESFAVRE